ncbi:hypothetical protein [Chitinivorax sp. B]|uniref:hypothetical protein n=1 Tax=Chitinivorax sp. B TaxID=2502235 RepID=UPI001484F9D2|nr:hypothetical protein [Chitinivorax sp. B]
MALECNFQPAGTQLSNVLLRCVWAVADVLNKQQSRKIDRIGIKWVTWVDDDWAQTIAHRHGIVRWNRPMSLFHDLLLVGVRG